jgi:hypothetical protein
MCKLRIGASIFTLNELKMSDAQEIRNQTIAFPRHSAWRPVLRRNDSDEKTGALLFLKDLINTELHPYYFPAIIWIGRCQDLKSRIAQHQRGAKFDFDGVRSIYIDHQGVRAMLEGP